MPVTLVKRGSGIGAFQWTVENFVKLLFFSEHLRSIENSVQSAPQKNDNDQDMVRWQWTHYNSMCKICKKLIVKTPEQRHWKVFFSGAFIVDCN